MDIKSINDIKHAYYINLEKRTDRKIHVENELSKIGITAERFNAIELPDGSLGCSMSHLKCIENAKKNKWDHVLIVEDDITFLDKDLFITHLNKFLKINKTWDVILFAGNVYKPYIKYGDFSIKVFRCQTTTGYLVKSSYYDKLIQNYKEGLTNLMREPKKANQFAIDKYWFRLQEKDSWYLITPPTVIQRDDYSDIEKKQVNYLSFMTIIDKEFTNRNQEGVVHMDEKIISKPPQITQNIIQNNNKLFNNKASTKIDTTSFFK